jgi:hypothetical protein
MRIDYDMGGRGMVQEGVTVADYVESLVRDVLSKVGQEAAADYKFYMHPETWKRVVDVYACLAPEGEPAQVPIAMIEHLRRNMVYFKTLTVDGVTYSVVLDVACPMTEIWFLSDPVEEPPGASQTGPRISQIGRD